MKPISQLRQDLVSGDWILLATNRARRPHDFILKERKEISSTIKDCPFEKPLETGHEVVFELPQKNWQVMVIKNKYPAVGKGICGLSHSVSPYQWLEGVGFHELFIFRDHQKFFAEFSQEDFTLILKSYRERFLSLKDQDCIEYISIFHNHGVEAGASIFHPHSQLIALPVIPPDVSCSLSGAKNYFVKHKKCVHCAMIEWELISKERLIFENDGFLVFCPFASRTAFEIRIFPKEHKSFFEKTEENALFFLSEALLSAIKKLFHGLDDPPYNLFLHTAPCGDEDFSFYHWHFEIIPKTAVWAGFEIGTGIEIITIAPEDASKYLREVKI